MEGRACDDIKDVKRYNNAMFTRACHLQERTIVLSGLKYGGITQRYQKAKKKDRITAVLLSQSVVLLKDDDFGPSLVLPSKHCTLPS
jgi:hypothetical protein